MTDNEMMAGNTYICTEDKLGVYSPQSVWLSLSISVFLFVSPAQDKMHGPAASHIFFRTHKWARLLSGRTRKWPTNFKCFT